MSHADLMKRLVLEGPIVVAFPREPEAWARDVAASFARQTGRLDRLQAWWKARSTAAEVASLPAAARELLVDAYNDAVFRLQQTAKGQ